MNAHVWKKLSEFGIKPGDTVGTAVSGGMDSMVLLDVLCNLRAELNIIVVAYHFEHGIRAAESMEDMRFVKRECDARSVKCITGSDDVVRLAREWGVSLETAARRARYAFLDAQQGGFIATAHHAGDMAETVVMNLCRGSGLKGLCGIPERRGRYIRPLLEIMREQIESYAAANGVKYVHDSTNDDTAYTRNFVRAKVLPRLTDVNEQALMHIAATAKLLAEDEAALEEAAKSAGGIEKTKDGVTVDIGVLFAQSVAVRKRIMRLALHMCGGLKDISQGHVDDMLILAQRHVSGKSIELPGHTVVAVEYDKLSIGKKKANYHDTSIGFHGQGRYELNDIELWCEAGEQRICQPKTECFDIGGLAGSCFRHRLEGDYIRPLGMQGKKRLCDYLSDRKVPLLARDALVVLAKGSEVYWVVGVGVSETTKTRQNAQCYIIRYGEKQNA
jgi:tRNA(Ile)-lysidine synthase